MTPFTPEQRDALNVAFGLLCRAEEALQTKISALTLVVTECNLVTFDELDHLIDLVRDHHEISRLSQPPVNSVRQAVARILAGNITEADRSETVVFPCDPPRGILGGALS
jgi:hypothetical protein